MEVVCTQTYINMQQIGRGTIAEVLRRGETMVLTIKTPAKDTEMHPGELLDVTRGDFQNFWQEVAPAARVDWDDDRGKQRQRHPADPDFGP